jgi:hypothetical protein
MTEEEIRQRMLTDQSFQDGAQAARSLQYAQRQATGHGELIEAVESLAAAKPDLEDFELISKLGYIFSAPERQERITRMTQVVANKGEL